MTGVLAQPIVRVNEESQVAEARRTAALLTCDSGFTATELGQISVVVTELATNLVKHAKDGRLAMRRNASSRSHASSCVRRLRYIAKPAATYTGSIAEIASHHDRLPMTRSHGGGDCDTAAQSA